ncbi:4Fe-4S dicluster domain-containing protein [Maridesulfovibrio sp.]|uniref:4Fe-4S dicluster domain-containing protein n=1 Tax=Maridesulfovibrio sp. TaxID=2795000 RepID=UPI003BABBF47|nr:4Fe-4S dicluster domain-containing protein [Spirochaetales bacterium]
MPEYHDNSIIYGDQKKCIGCKQCEISCAESHSGCNLIEAQMNGYKLVSRIHIIQIDGINVPMQCRQCEDAPCAYACPTGAIYQDSGIVKINEKQCIGCKACVIACPFGAIEVCREGFAVEPGRTNLGIAKKCNLCEHRSTAGSKPLCSCVNACPTGALKLIKLSEYRKMMMRSRAREMAHIHSNNQG